MSERVLELDQVSYWYPGAARPSLADVSLSVERGELVVVAGGSGSGKSTLLGAASGLVPHFHGGRFAGRARVAGLDTREHGPGELADVVGTLFQDPETQVVMGTVRAEIALPLENRGQAAPAVARGVEEAALALGVAHLLDRLTSELSGGELQRVALAASLAGRPELLVLDEPTSQLDPVAGDELIGTLRRINEDRDAAILLAEHRLERCLGWADRVLVVRDGRIACDAPPQEFLVWALAHDPDLATPGARLLDGLGVAPEAGVKAARRALRSRGLVEEVHQRAEAQGDPGPERRWRGARTGVKPSTRQPTPDALRLEGVWHELRDGPAILRGVSLRVAPGERIALMGANGAGKSTLLRHARGLMEPTRGRITRSGKVALLLQNPTDYLVHEQVSAEAPASALTAVGLDPASFGARHPRELSVGEKQRLALAVVLADHDGASAPAVVCLDEPTRGLDRRRKRELAELLQGLSGAAVIVATHDPEFASALAERVVLLAQGRVIADGPIAEILSDGTYFATETARILGGAGGVLTPEEGVARLRRPARSPSQEMAAAEVLP
jgi:energy-coupling factor transport system ATP-binding protein